MKYQPYWQRILFLAVILNLFLFLGSSSFFYTPQIKQSSSEDLQEIEWIEIENTETTLTQSEISASETFPEIVMPPLEIQHTIFEPLPELKTSTPKVEETVEIENEVKPPEEKKSENPLDKLKVIVKVYPKDIIGQFILTGVSEEKFNYSGEKIILAVTIGIDGKVKPGSVEIISGSTGELIDLVAKTAAGSWRFEPYLDENGNSQELKTQMEFTKEDFKN